MRKEVIESLIKLGSLRHRQLDLKKIKSMMESAEINAGVAKNISLNERTATVIFREIYESIRQLGEAKWWIEGYEPQGVGSHGLALDMLREMDIKEKVKLNYLERFKKIRHDANYDGFKVSVSQAEEIIDFWDKCAVEIIGLLKKDIAK